MGWEMEGEPMGGEGTGRDPTSSHPIHISGYAPADHIPQLIFLWLYIVLATVYLHTKFDVPIALSNPHDMMVA